MRFADSDPHIARSDGIGPDPSERMAQRKWPDKDISSHMFGNGYIFRCCASIRETLSRFPDWHTMTVQGASFQKDGGTDPRSIMGGKFFNIRYINHIKSCSIIHLVHLLSDSQIQHCSRQPVQSDLGIFPDGSGHLPKPRDRPLSPSADNRLF